MDFNDLPFKERPDLTQYLYHFTKRKGNKSAFENLIEILKDGVIYGSKGSDLFKKQWELENPDKDFDSLPHKKISFDIWRQKNEGFIKENIPVVCFMDIPRNALKYIMTSQNIKRYEPYGIFVKKDWAYKKKIRPVLYLSEEECLDLSIPKEEKWRTVTFKVRPDGKWISFIHEREWRCKENLQLSSNTYGIIVQNTEEKKKLEELIIHEPSIFKFSPRMIVCFKNKRDK